MPYHGSKPDLLHLLQVGLLPCRAIPVADPKTLPTPIGKSNSKLHPYAPSEEAESASHIEGSSLLHVSQVALLP